MAFNGKDDALFFPGRPLVGAKTFTIEAIFRPEGGAEQQRWMHIVETDPATGLDAAAAGTSDPNPRFMFEIRVEGNSWYLDAYLNSKGSNQALAFPEKLHPIGPWYAVEQTYDGTTYRSYVNGELQGEAEDRQFRAARAGPCDGRDPHEPCELFPWRGGRGALHRPGPDAGAIPQGAAGKITRGPFIPTAHWCCGAAVSMLRRTSERGRIMVTESNPDRRTVVAAAAAATATLGFHGAAMAATPPVATTRYGRVRGTVDQGVYVFKGVRYGADTAAYRFQPPRPPAPWKDIVAAEKYGPASPQPKIDEPTSEDCLVLNIWTAGLARRQEARGDGLCSWRRPHLGLRRRSAI